MIIVICVIVRCQLPCPDNVDLPCLVLHTCVFNRTAVCPLLSEQIMGMAFQNKSAGNFPPVFQTLVDEEQVEEPMFAFYLSNSSCVHGELVLGGYDSNHFKVGQSLLLLACLFCSFIKKAALTQLDNRVNWIGYH